MAKRPNSLRHLDDAIRRATDGTMEGYVKTRTLIANAIVAQMIPDGVIKGGSAIKMCFGNAHTRFTTDLDTATATKPEEYVAALAATLSQGWEGFTGRVVPRDPAQPDSVPPEYVMQPFDVKLSYKGKPWCTVPLEIGHNEIGDAEAIEWVELNDASKILQGLGFPALGKAPLMPLTYQVAQKLHAVSDGGDRVRDLVDLQLISRNAELDLPQTKQVCIRLFSYRKKQAWPPTVVQSEGWSELYAAQSEGFPVKQSIESAVDWVNELIREIESSS